MAGAVLETVQEGGVYSGRVVTFVPTSEAGVGAGGGGKVPTRVPSEPHSLAAMGMAGMGGRHQVRATTREALPCACMLNGGFAFMHAPHACHPLSAWLTSESVLQPATTHASLGMRKVKSTSNFAQSMHQYAPMHSMHVSMAMPTMAPLRASPSMPSFPMVHPAPKEEPVDAGLPHIAEEREDPLRLPDNVASMFLDEPDLAASDDLMSLMKDLQGPVPSGLELDLGLADPGVDAVGASGETAGGSGVAAASPTAAAAAAVAVQPPHSDDFADGAIALDTEPAASAPHSVDVLDPAFFNLDTDDHYSMAMLDDDFTSAFMDA